jgi:competence protein ComEA
MKVRVKKKVAGRMLLLGVVCVMLAGCGGKGDGPDDALISFSTDEAGQDVREGEPGSEVEQDPSDGQEGNPATEITVAEVYVHVCGSVNNPGVYKLRPEARVYEAIEAAGGLRVDAAEEAVNQARMVEDGQKVYVPSAEEVGRGWEDSPGASGVSDTSGGGVRTEASPAKVNINSATVEELKTLPGIGDAKAQSIVSYRQVNGAFSSIEDLMKVEGIKGGVFDKIKDQITV